ncbi:MAG: DUF3987 domain-containing protein [Nitrososphaera sp.]|nr:DUF3987 domain-containing protein [Nitrososphaera sp.]
MARELSNWIQGYREYSSESEAPDSFHFWIALSTLASVLRRNVRLDMGIFPLYPNLYITLVSPAGKVGKSINVRLGRELLQRIEGIYIGPDSCTREELIQSMVNSELATQSAVTVHSSEMSSIIDPSGIKMIQFLTDIYDCPNIWRYDTKASGRFTVNFPCLNMLACTTPTWISTGFPEAATQQGFTARTVFVYEEETRKSNPWPKAPNQELIEKLVSDLNYISTLQGEFQVTPAAVSLYNRKYDEWRLGSPKDYRVEGYYHRKRIHVLKIAMIISVADRDNLIISERDLQLALGILEVTEANMVKTFSAVGKYEHADALERILGMVVTSGQISMADVYARTYHEASKDEIWRIVSTLDSMGAIKITRTEKGVTLIPGRPLMESKDVRASVEQLLTEAQED